MSATALGEVIAYYGKLPSCGDFVGEGLDADVRERWAEWLQASMAISREQLADDWLGYYLSSPVWRFVIDRDVCGDTAVAGVMLPSVDQIGRHFPFVVMYAISCVPTLATRDAPWFEQLELAALSILDDAFELGSWRDVLATLVPPSGATENLWRSVGSGRHRTAWLCSGEGVDGQAQDDFVFHRFLREQLGPYSVWWTSGSDDVAPCRLLVPGFPPVGQFSAMMDGQWERPCR